MNSAAEMPDSGALSDAEIVQRVADGDERAFALLMRRNNRTLFRAARGILREDAIAEDAVQEAYLQAYRAIDRFRGECTLRTWLVRIVINKALEKMRERKRDAGNLHYDNVVELEAHLESAAMPRPGAESPERAAMRGEMLRLLENRINRLPPAFRSVFMLRALEDMSVEETAACLGIPEATVRTRYFRARGLLRESLAQEIDLTLDEAFAFAGARCDRIVARVLAGVRELRRH